MTTDVKDIDGNSYKTVEIGDQIWMAENLKVTHYRNGDPIPNLTKAIYWFNIYEGAYSNFDNDENNVETYGRLYNGYAVDDVRGLAPKGWHIPTDEEWTILTDYLSPEGIDHLGNSLAGRMMKSTGTLEGGDGLWNGLNEGASNDSGFTALPGGRRDGGDGSYSKISDAGYFWSSSEFHGECRELSCNDSSIHRIIEDVTGGFSIRCVRDRPFDGKNIVIRKEFKKTPPARIKKPLSRWFHVNKANIKRIIILNTKIWFEKLNKYFKKFFEEDLARYIKLYWQKVHIPLYRYRIIEVLVCLFIGLSPTETEGEIFIIAFLVGVSIIGFAMSYHWNSDQYKIFLYNKRKSHIISCIIGGLLMAPMMLFMGLSIFIMFIVVQLFFLLREVYKTIKEKN